MNSIFSTITFSVVYFIQTDALKNQYQLAVSNDDMSLIMQEGRQFESALFKSLMKDGKTISLPYKQFNLRAFIVEEDEYIS